MNDAAQQRQRQQQQMQGRQQMTECQDTERMRRPQQFQQKLQQRHQDPAYRALNPGKAPKYY